MCGRFALTVDIEKIAKTFGVEPTLNTMRRYNIAPTQNVVSIVRNGEAHLAELRWGLIPSWAKDESVGARMINARAESLTEKPSFKGLLRSKRCLIVADGFYEWRQENGYKTPMFISMNQAGAIGRAWRVARALWLPAVARFSLTCLSMRIPRRSTPGAST